MKSKLLFVTVFLLSSVASAQNTAPGAGWLVDRSRSQGPGFRVGNLELHPGVGAEVGYDTNVFFEDTNSEGSLLFRVTPHLFLSTLTAARQTEGEGADSTQANPMVAFSAGLSGELYIFLADQARNNVAINADVDLTINPYGQFSLRLYDNFARQVRPFTGRARVSEEIVRDYAVDHNTAGVEISGRSKGGLLQARLGYGFRFQLYEGSVFQFGNQLEHRISADTHFRFFPNTSLFWDATADYTTFNSAGTSSPLLLPNNWRMRTRVGVNGAITPKLSATAAVGYTASFINLASIPDFDTVIALAGLKYRLTPTITLGAGYERENQGSLTGLYRLSDRGYIDYSMLIGGSFLLNANVSLAALGFGTIASGAGTALGERSDLFLAASLFGEYRFNDWLALNATLNYQLDSTDFQYPVDTGAGTVLEPAGYSKFEAWLGVRAFY